MAISINGTSGISGVDGSAGTPAIQGTDTNTGISFGTDEVNVNTGGTTRAKVDSSGRLLVGTTSTAADCTLFLNGHSGGSSTPAIQWLSTNQNVSAITGGDTGIGYLRFGTQDGGLGTQIAVESDAQWGAGDYPARLVFSTTADAAASPTERLRIASTGAFGLSGANYGTSGQVLTSQGSSAAPQWVTPGGGKILQVVQTIKTDTDSSTSTSFVDISGLSATITPSSTSSKVLVIVGIGGASSQYDQRGVLYRILRGSTAIGQGDNAQTGPCGWGQMSYTSYVNGSHSPVILDSPSTTSATTYKVQWHISAGMTFYINRTYSGTTGLFQRRSASTITLMEVEA